MIIIKSEFYLGINTYIINKICGFKIIYLWIIFISNKLFELLIKKNY